MKKIIQIWDKWWELPEDHTISDEQLLKISADQLHVFMLGMIFFLTLAFTILSYIFNTIWETGLTAVPMVFTVYNYYGLYRKGHKIASKLLASLVLILIVYLLVLLNGVQNGDIIFMVPVIIGTLIIFQGDEKAYAVYMAIGALVISSILLLTNLKVTIVPGYKHYGSSVEQFLNYTGALVATIFEVGFLIVVNRRLQERTTHAKRKLRFINEALSSAIKNNERQTKLISKQLEEIKKADMELKKLSLIATMTVNAAVISDNQGRVEWANKSFERITGYTLDEVKGLKPKDFLQRGDAGPVSGIIADKLRRKEHVDVTIINYRKDKTPYHNHLQITPVFDEHGKHTNFIALQRDITKEVNYLKEIERLKNNYEQVVAEVTNDYIWEWDLKGDKIILGRGLDDIFDKVTNVDVSHYVWKQENLHPDDLVKLLELRKQGGAMTGNKFQMEYRYRDKKGNYRIFFDRAFIRYNERGEAIHVIGAISDITDKKRMEEELIEQRLKEQKLIAQIALQSQEKEKNKIAAQLHENINQILAASKMYLDLYRTDQGRSDKFLIKSQESIEKALHEIRTISHALAAPFAGDYDLLSAIQELLDQYLSKDAVTVRINNELPKDLLIPDEIKLLIYRILQEQVQNIHMHAKAKSMELVFRGDPSKIYFSIEDDGQGFEMEKLNAGLGLKTIQSRVSLQGGQMHLSSAPGKGCKLEVHLPLSKQGNLF